MSDITHHPTPDSVSRTAKDGFTAAGLNNGTARAAREFANVDRDQGTRAERERGATRSYARVLRSRGCDVEVTDQAVTALRADVR